MYFLLITHIVNIFSWCVAFRSLSSWDLLLEVLNLNAARFMIYFFPNLYIGVLFKKALPPWGPKDMLGQCLKKF